MTPDGRFVLFASSANNLAAGADGGPYLSSPTFPLNVYLRDRTSNTTVLASVDATGTSLANLDALPMGISTNGQFALFESTAGNLAPGCTNGYRNVYVRDLVNGTNILVSVSTNGVSGNGDSYNSVMTPNGRYVAFTSAASNLVPGDTNGIPDVFLRDLVAGTTVCVSTGAMSTGSSTLVSVSDTPSITPDGRYVAYFSTATNLVTGVTVGGEVYVRDMTQGKTTWASAAARSLYQSVAGTTNAVSCNVNIAANGAYVGFEACANPPTTSNARGIILRYGMSSGLTDLAGTNAYVPLTVFQDVQTLSMDPEGRYLAYVANVNGVSGSYTAVYRWDYLSGTNVLVSANTNNVLSSLPFCDSPAISSSGRYVTFVSAATDLVSNAPVSGYHVYVRDVTAGTTGLVDADTNGQPAGVDYCVAPVISSDGQSVAYETTAGTLIPGDYNQDYDVFVRNLTNGTTQLISAAQPSLPTLAANGFSMFSAEPLSPDGHYLAFASDATDLVPGDTNGLRDVFVCDLFAGTNTLVSVGTNGAGANGISYDAAVNGNGQYVAFTSMATNLIARDTNGCTDVFVRDLAARTNYLISVNAAGTGEGNSNSFSPLISADGRYVYFVSQAGNLVSGTVTVTNNLYLRDRQAGVTYALTTGGLVSWSMTGDGSYVAFTDAAGSSAGKFYVWQTQLAKRIATNSTSGPILQLSISPDASRVAYFAGTGTPVMSVWNRLTSQILVVAHAYPTILSGLQFSADGRFLSYAAPPASGGAYQVYLYDSLLQSNRLVSTVSGATNAPVAGSDTPDISADGNWVVYRSAATNIVAGVTNGVPNIYLYSVPTGLNYLLNPDGWQNAAANNRSYPPVFSGNGRTLVFQSWASDLAGGGFGQTAFLYAYNFLYASVSGTAGGPMINWPAVPGQNYSVQYKNNLTDATWNTSGGTVVTNGNQAWLTDPGAPAGSRFYRVVSGN